MASGGELQIKVLYGDLPQHTADVLVNSVGNSVNLMERKLSCKMLNKAGEEMQMECTINCPNGLKKGKMVCTQGYGLDCKEVYHVNVPHFMARKRYEDHTTEQMLFVVVKRCLSQCNHSNYHTIAFPTLGVGFLGFNPDIAAEAFCEAVRDFQHDHKTSSIHEVHVIVYEKDPHGEAIKTAYEEEAARMAPGEDMSIAKKSFYKKSPAVPILIRVARRPKGTTNDDTKQNVEAKPAVLTQPTNDTTPNVTDEPERRTKAFLKYLLKKELTTPFYWTKFDSSRKIDDYLVTTHVAPMHLVDVDNATKQEIAKLVSDTWLKDHVGHGVDAQQLNHKALKVTKVQRVENVIQFSAYTMVRQGLIRKAISKGAPLKSLQQVQNRQPGALTDNFIDQSGVLHQDMYSEVNEGYYFHGTGHGNIEAICRSGLDSRLSNDECMHGRGVYFAESSTKADQYADDHSNRTNKGKTIILSRVCLGEPYISKPWIKFVRPPCKTCFSDNCNVHHEFFDSVVTQTGAKLFREFVIYHPQQAYPEYVITYDRI